MGLVSKLESNMELLAYLYERWLNESSYEDLGDYLEVVKKNIPEVYKIDKDFTIYCIGGIEVRFSLTKDKIVIDLIER